MGKYTPDKIKGMILENIHKLKDDYKVPYATSLYEFGSYKVEKNKEEESIDNTIVARLLNIPNDEDFIKECYWKILHREPDIDGITTYMREIKVSNDRIGIIRSLAFSTEAVSKGILYTSSINPSFFKRMKVSLRDISILGHLLKVIYKRLKYLKTFWKAIPEHKVGIEIQTEQFKEELKVNREVFNHEIEDINKRLNFVSRKLDILNYELKKRTGMDIDQTIQEIASKDFSPKNHIYFAFENTFRGSRDDIKNRQLKYVNYIIDAYKVSKGKYLLDIGCGRGEFLEILKEHNIPSKGIDIDEVNTGVCKEFQLDIELIDILQFLKSVDNNSLIGITAFQVVEHFNTAYLIEFIRVSFQKIKEGGVIILETANPLSFYSLKNFFLDLTHRNPIPPDTLRFLVETSGFRSIEVIFSSPVQDEIKLKGNDENIRKLNEVLFGFQDYVVIGRK